jgi:hypothetical protein
MPPNALQLSIAIQVILNTSHVAYDGGDHTSNKKDNAWLKGKQILRAYFTNKNGVSFYTKDHTDDVKDAILSLQEGFTNVASLADGRFLITKRVLAGTSKDFLWQCFLSALLQDKRLERQTDLG